MKTNLKNLSSILTIFLFLAGQVLAEPAGRGGGHGHGGYGAPGGRAGGPGHASAGGPGHAPGGTPHGNPHPSNPPGGRAIVPHGVHPGPAYHGPMHPGPEFYRAHYGAWYHGDWHNHWVHPWPCHPVGWVSFGVGVGVGFGVGVAVWDAPWHWGYWPYYNPYCTEVIVVENTPIDYSRPIVVARVPANVDAEAAQAEAAQLLDAARNAFAREDYAAALTDVNLAIAKRPNDALLHEFRALVFFATGQYKPAAAAMYAVLSVGPGWDWPTMIGMYSRPEAYTAQLRSLEAYRDTHLATPEIRFLLAYHYMSCGYNDAAAAELREVVRLSPRDQLSSQLLAGLSGEKSPTKPAVAGPAIAAKPATAAAMVGDWHASRDDGSSFALKLTGDGTFAWHYAQNGASQDNSGTFTVADNLLILKQNGNATMIGQVSLLDDNRFNFKLVGDNPSDPGITFARR